MYAFLFGSAKKGWAVEVYDNSAMQGAPVSKHKVYSKGAAEALADLHGWTKWNY
jgi:hypothetical protein